MSKLNIVIGRGADCDLQLDDPTVSAHHARLLRTRRGLVVEDLSSANGTYVRGKRVRRKRIRPGDDVVLGQVSLPWSHETLRPWVRVAAGKTAPLRAMQAGSPEVRAAGTRRTRRTRRVGLLVFGLVAALLLLWSVRGPVSGTASGGLANKVREAAGASAEAALDLSGLTREEAAIRVRSAPKVAAAIDPVHPTTRNTAVKLAAKSKGPFHVDQVARVWLHAYKRWRYVNDPKGQEYFAKASESIDNGYAGDCDDFATVVVAMIQAIGGEARVVMMESDQGGHAYAETRVEGSLRSIQRALDRFARKNLKGQRVRKVHARSVSPPSSDSEEQSTSGQSTSGQSTPSSFWINLDWNARVPGGAYENERWAVAIYPDGRTEQLAPAGQEKP